MLPMFLSSFLPLWRSSMTAHLWYGGNISVCVCAFKFACRWCDMYAMSLCLYADIHAWVCVMGDMVTSLTACSDNRWVNRSFVIYNKVCVRYTVDLSVVYFNDWSLETPHFLCNCVLHCQTFQWALITSVEWHCYPTFCFSSPLFNSQQYLEM